MAESLRSIIEGMEHKYFNHTRYRNGVLETFCGGGDCPKCRLLAVLAALAEAEKEVDRIKAEARLEEVQDIYGGNFRTPPEIQLKGQANER